jgi:hypothetical protein
MEEESGRQICMGCHPEGVLVKEYGPCADEGEEEEEKKKKLYFAFLRKGFES